MTKDKTERACVSCDEIYRGECPSCGEPGEPLDAFECAVCGSADLRFDPGTDSLDCVSCGEGPNPRGVPMVELMDDSGEWLRGAARDEAIQSYTDEHGKAHTVH